jgi:hypothetical protein
LLNSRGPIDITERDEETGTIMMSPTAKAGGISAVHVVAAAAVYRYLITGGWLTNHYQLNDPNIVNLVLAIFEPIAIVSVIAYWLLRKPALYRLIFILSLVQLLIGAGFLIFVLLFALTWHPKMM